MSSWNLAFSKKREFDLVGSDVTVRFSKHSTPDVAWLMNRMEELNVPLQYTRELKEIYITRLPSNPGDYVDCKIRLSSLEQDWKVIDKVLIHELGHHVDVVYALTDDEDLLKEKTKKAKMMPDRYANKNVFEYLACGFEVYYCGTKEEKKKFKKSNPILFKKIKKIHKFCSKL